MVSFTLATASTAGRRPYQEDESTTVETALGPLLAIADGMGGHTAGDVASRLVIEAIRDAAESASAGDDPQTFLADAGISAHDRLARHQSEYPDDADSGTTLVVALVAGSRLVVGHAGDSRAWMLSGGEIACLTTDHSAVQQAIERGVIREDESDLSPYQHALVRYLGGDSFEGLEIHEHELPSGPACVLLTSDGAHGDLRDADYLEHLHGTKSAKHALEHLMRLAYHYGSTDNITLAACEIGRLERSASASQEPPEIPHAKTLDETYRERRPNHLKLAAGVCAGLALVLLIALGFFAGR